MNWQANRPKRVVELQSKQSKQLRAIIELDCEFLRSKGLMDYSLYLTVEKVLSANKLSPNRNRIYSYDGTELYHIGIIDYLQEWNLFKKVESKWKTLWTLNGIEISCVEPNSYKSRFCEFV